MIEFLYKQELGEPYSTTWYGRLESSNGPWRDVYVETNEKFVTNGILSFRCDTDSVVAWVTYDEDRFGSPSNRHVVTIHPSELRKWRASDLDTMEGEDPPYQLYQTARSKFC